MYCRNCGAKIGEGALFCRKCGTAVTAEEQKPEQNVFEDLKPARRKPKRDVPQADPPQETDLSEEAEIPERTEAENAENRPAGTYKKRRLLLIVGACALLLAVVLAAVIIPIAACGKPERFTSPEAVRDAAVSALEQGDGKRLSELAQLSEQTLGRHPEVFGDGETPKAVMRGYYDRLAGDLRTRLSERYGRDFRLESATETHIEYGTEIFEPNRALEIDAAQYAEITGTLTVGGETVANIRIVAAELDGEWKLIVVYVY